MIDLNRNNLDKSNSPYLLQHKLNPIWWQEWSPETIQNAVREHKPLFVSVGYATCHWCHVMAAEAFSHRETADYLNGRFISIKVDREQRPDIDQFLMHFLNERSGNGGWPLNAFLTPELRPIFALTYAPAGPAVSPHSFLNVVVNIYEYYKSNANDIEPYIPGETQPPATEEALILNRLLSSYDSVNGGLGGEHKFPPHSTLLYLLHYLCVENSQDIQTMCVKTLDAMRLRGLNDHLQGGIFRYCVDSEWTIPHFEKMLYDQAMALWCYALGYKVLRREPFRKMAESVIRCLEECFDDKGLFISGHDADVDHEEGATYLWSYAELKATLLPEEFSKFCESYDIKSPGNFMGKIHLIRKNDAPLKDIEEKLLLLRRKRPQPERDTKILCGLNALVVIALIQAARNMERPDLEEKAARLMHQLIELFWDGTTLGHSFYGGVMQKQSFLFDAAAMLTALTMLSEEDITWHALTAKMAVNVQGFKEGERWVESRAEDFQPVYASWFDHPVPSSIGLAEMGLARWALLTGNHMPTKPCRAPFAADFLNVTAMLSNGLFHLITAKKPLPWPKLSPNSLQIRGEPESDCFRGTCRILQQ